VAREGLDPREGRRQEGPSPSARTPQLGVSRFRHRRTERAQRWSRQDGRFRRRARSQPLSGLSFLLSPSPESFVRLIPLLLVVTYISICLLCSFVSTKQTQYCSLSFFIVRLCLVATNRFSFFRFCFHFLRRDHIPQSLPTAFVRRVEDAQRMRRRKGRRPFFLPTQQ
jgi:hypothetical protein